MIYKYTQLKKRLPYLQAKDEATKLYKKDKRWHIGQLKLFLTEMLFLSKKAKAGNKLLYVGAAGGYHTAKLADLFPDISFDLWDPGVFEVESRPNIKIFHKFFTDQDAERYKSEAHNLLFNSDIRNLKIAQLKESDSREENDKVIVEDLDKQVKWVRTIKPISACIKFRLPFFIPKTKSLKGKIYLQPFSPPSTEMRLITDKYDEFVEYDNQLVDERLAYFNHKIRNSDKKYKRWDDIMKKYKIKNNWDNALALYIINYYLKKVKGIDSDDETAKLYIDVIDFLRRKNSKKMDVIFERR